MVNHYLIAPTKSGANNKDAKIFIDYVNSKDGQAILAKAGSARPPPNKARFRPFKTW